MAPPSIKMMTPSGRFVPNRSICFSMSNYHPELWQPSWTVRSICIGFLSFMQTDEQTTGGMVSTDNEKRVLARQSIAFNAKEPKFCSLFPHLVAGIPNPKPVAPAASSSSSSSLSSSSDTASTKSESVPAAPAPAAAIAVPVAVADVAPAPEPQLAPVPVAATPPKAAPLKKKAPSEMSVKELKLALKELGVSSDDCVEKADMVAKLERSLL
jgi:ubiquitin-conjugating enzyme E2 J2